MRAAFLRRVAIAMLAVLAFAQASLAFADCTHDRSTLADGMASGMESSANPCPSDTCVSSAGPQYANRCMAHCTSDLQVSGTDVVLFGGPVAVHYLVVPPALPLRPASGLFRDGGPPQPPQRILLHSFLI